MARFAPSRLRGAAAQALTLLKSIRIFFADL
jgi:hypothetical protein